MVHTEVVLQGDGSEGLCSSLHFHTLLGLDSLMQAIAIAAAFHDTAGLLVHNLHLTLLGHDVLGILFEHRIGLEQLVDGVYTLALHGIVGEEFVLLHQQFITLQTAALKCSHLRSNIGQHEECRIRSITRDKLDTLICKVYTVQLFIDNEVERFYSLGHTTVVLLHIDGLGLEHTGLDTRFAEELDERLVLGQCLMAAEECEETCLYLLLIL